MIEGGDQAAHKAALSGSCPACTAILRISFGFTITSTLLGDQAFMSERTRRVILAAIEAVERELRSEGN